MTRGLTGAYPHLSSYGLIGDMRSAALVGRDGSIDWCCFPRFDSASVFAAVLDAERGGRFRIRPTDAHTPQQRYVGLTNILATTFTTHPRSDVAEVIDFMPVPADERSILWPHEIHRRVRGLRGEVELEILFEPRFDYGRSRPRIVLSEAGLHVSDGTEEMSLAGPASLAWAVDEDAARATARVRVRKDDVLWLVLRYDAAEVQPVDAYGSTEALAATAGFWERWVRPIAYDGPYRTEVERSALALKLLFYTPTGAVVAAPTTSLPEEIGGVRNWDYRFSWIRDATFTLSAFHQLGHHTEAERYVRYLLWVASKGERLQIVYGIGGETDLREVELDHLEGYRGSRPVRVGNDAVGQLQLDVYGELLDVAFLWHGVNLVRPALWNLLARLADTVVERWREPDHGIWEIRGEPRHYVHSKLMCWVALDRAARMAPASGSAAQAERWARERELIRHDLMTHGWSAARNSFVQSYGSDCLDAANLLFAVVGFLPGDHPRVRGTIAAALEHLGHDGMLYRYTGDDGLPGAEGIFAICSFWLADALVLAGEVDHGERVFKRMLRWANPLGLFSEEIDPDTGDFLGNFPQAFTHIALIDTAHRLERARRRQGER